MSESFSSSCDGDSFACYDTQVTGDNLLAALAIDTVLGLLCYAGFVLWRGSFRVYHGREYLPNKRRRPPPLRLGGHRQLWSWLVPAWKLSDKDFLASAGLDALVAVRIIALGVALFIPVLVLGIGVLLPVNYHGGYIDEQAIAAGNASYASSGNVSYTFLKMSMSNIKPGSSLHWVHFTFLVLIVLWACFLLLVFYDEHVAVARTVLIEDVASPQEAWELDIGSERISETENLADLAGHANLEISESDAPVESTPAFDPDAASTADALAPTDFNAALSTTPAATATTTTSEHSFVDEPPTSLKTDLNGPGPGPYKLSPVRVPMLPSPSRPSCGGKYAVVVLDEPPQQFVVKRARGLGMGLVRMESSIVGRPSEVEKKRHWLDDAAAVADAVRSRTLVRRHNKPGSTPTSMGKESQSKGERQGVAGQLSEDVESGAGEASDVVEQHHPEVTSFTAGLEAEDSLTTAIVDPDTVSAVDNGAAKPIAGWTASFWATVKHLLPGKRYDPARVTRARMQVVQTAYKRLFAEDFDRLVPIYPTKEVDGKLQQLYHCQAARLRTEWTLQSSNSGATRKLRPRKQSKLEQRLQNLKKKEAKLQAAAVACRTVTLSSPPCPSFFAVFHSARAAKAAAGLNINPATWRAFHVCPAPDTGDINFPTLQRTWWGRTVRRAVALALTIIIMLIPIGLITGLFSQLAVALCGGSQNETGSFSGDWFCSDDWWASFLRNIITGVLPSILMAVYQTVVLPVYLYACAQLESRHLSLSGLDRRIAQLAFYWNVFNFFLGALLGGTVLNGLREAIENPRNIISLLGSAVPSSANFFINYVIYKALTMCAFRLFYPHAEIALKIAQWLRVLPRPQAPIDIQRSNPLRNCRFSRDLSVAIFSVYVAGLGYACITPIIIPFALLFFMLSFIVWRYQQLYVYQSTFRSSYLFSWAAHRLMACLGVMTIFTGAFFLVRQAYWQGMLTLVGLGLFVILFDRYLVTRYDVLFEEPPAAVLEEAPRLDLDPELFVAPPLREGARGWFLEWGKAWEFWGAPRYVA